MIEMPGAETVCIVDMAASRVIVPVRVLFRVSRRGDGWLIEIDDGALAALTPDVMYVAEARPL